MNSLQILSVIIFSMSIKYGSFHIATGFPSCRRQSPQISSCLADVFKIFRQKMTKGFPEMEIPPLEPFKMSVLKFTEEGNSFLLKFHNVSIHGLSSFDVKHIRTNMDALMMEVNMTAPKLAFEGDYEIKGNLFRVPLDSNGTTNFTFWDIPIHVKLSGSLSDGEDAEDKSKNHHHSGAKDNDDNNNRDKKVAEVAMDTYLQIKELSCYVDKPSSAYLAFTNLFQGDERRETKVSQLVNNNWYDIFKIYKYLPEQAFSRLFKNILEKVCKRTPFVKMFPE